MAAGVSTRLAAMGAHMFEHTHHTRCTRSSVSSEKVGRRLSLEHTSDAHPRNSGTHTKQASKRSSAVGSADSRPRLHVTRIHQRRAMSDQEQTYEGQCYC